MQFWQDVNLQAFHLATDTSGVAGLGLGRRYMLLRVEDLARPNDFAGTLARLLDFAGGDAPAEDSVGLFDSGNNDGYVLGSQSLSANMKRLKHHQGTKSYCGARLRPQPYEGSKYSGGDGVRRAPNGPKRRRLTGAPKRTLSASEILRTLGSTGQYGLEFFGYTSVSFYSFGEIRQSDATDNIMTS